MMSMLPRIGWAVLGLALVLTGCQPAADTGTAKDKFYDVTGKIVTIRDDKQAVTMDHEDIPGLMKAMKAMELTVEDPKLLDGIAVGDTVEGKLKVQSGNYILTQLKKR